MAAIQTASAGTVLNEDHLWELLNELYDVRTKWKWIGLGLRLRQSELDAMKGSDLDCLESMLTKWLKGINSLPTWGALVAALKSAVVDEVKKAQELHEKFCSATPTPTTPPVQATAPSQSSLTQGTVPSPSTPRHETTPNSPLSAANTDDDDDSTDDSLFSSRARPSLLSSIGRITDPEVKRKSKKKDFQFRSLVKRMYRHLSNTITTQKGFKDFRIEITLMPASKDGRQIYLSKEDRKAILNAKSFDQIFIVLNQYWTFHQYELLEYVVQEYGNALLKKKMKAYVAEMDKLEEEAAISHFTAVRLCSPRPDSVAMEVHLSGSQHMLRNGRLVQRSLAEQCGLFPHTIRIYQSTPGSTVLTLLIPYSVAGHVMATLRGMPPVGDLLSRPLEERVVYTMDEVETEMHLPLTVPEVPTILPGRRKRRQSADSLSSASTGYGTMSTVSGDTVSAVDEPSSKIAIFTRVLREKEKEVEEFQHKLKDQSSLEVLAKDTSAVCILGSVAPLPNESVVSQSPADLSDDDRQMLTELGLPPDKWDKLNALLALYNKTEYYDVFSVQVSKPGMELSRSYILEQIEFLLKNSTKRNGGAVVHYYGNGRRNTGDWCFRDGYITFRDIASLYMEHSRGRVLTLVPDCHSSGHWVSECAKFLDEQGVRPCGHSAKEKGILLRVYASSRTGQNAAELCYTTRAMELWDDGYVYHWTRKELSPQQNTFGYNFTETRCKKEVECGIASESTWPNVTASHRVYLVPGKDQGRPAWHYVLVDDDAENIKAFFQHVASGTVNVADYGTVLRSGWGKDPPQETKDLMERKYTL